MRQTLIRSLLDAPSPQQSLTVASRRTSEILGAVPSDSLRRHHELSDGQEECGNERYTVGRHADNRQRIRHRDDVTVSSAPSREQTGISPGVGGTPHAPGGSLRENESSDGTLVQLLLKELCDCKQQLGYVQAELSMERKRANDLQRRLRGIQSYVHHEDAECNQPYDSSRQTEFSNPVVTTTTRPASRRPHFQPSGDVGADVDKISHEVESDDTRRKRVKVLYSEPLSHTTADYSRQTAVTDNSFSSTRFTLL